MRNRTAAVSLIAIAPGPMYTSANVPVNSAPLFFIDANRQTPVRVCFLLPTQQRQNDMNSRDDTHSVHVCPYFSLRHGGGNSAICCDLFAVRTSRRCLSGQFCENSTRARSCFPEARPAMSKRRLHSFVLFFS